MADPHKNDISIGQDLWIASLPVEYAKDRVAEIDHLIMPLDGLWGLLEVHCVAGCCGMDAFSFWPEDIQGAYAFLQDPTIAQKLEELRTFVAECKVESFLSRRMNCNFARPVLLELIDHVAKNLKRPGDQR